MTPRGARRPMSRAEGDREQLGGQSPSMAAGRVLEIGGEHAKTSARCFEDGVLEILVVRPDHDRLAKAATSNASSRQSPPASATNTAEASCRTCAARHRVAEETAWVSGRSR